MSREKEERERKEIYQCLVREREKRDIPMSREREREEIYQCLVRERERERRDIPMSRIMSEGVAVSKYANCSFRAVYVLSYS